MNIVIKAETTPEELKQIKAEDLVFLSGTLGAEILNAIPQCVVSVIIAPDAAQSTVKGLPPHIKYVYFHRNSLFERFLDLPSHVVGTGFKRLVDVEVLNAVPKGKALILNLALAEFVSRIPANIDTICIHRNSLIESFKQLPAHITTVRLAESVDYSVLQFLPPSVTNVVVERKQMVGILDANSQQHAMLQTLQEENARLKTQIDLYKTPSAAYPGTFFLHEGDADAPTPLTSGNPSQPVEQSATEDAQPAAAQRKSQRILAQQKKNREEGERPSTFATIGQKRPK